jgi:RecA/RadA recombinase
MPKQVIKKGATIKKVGGVSGFKERKGMNREDDKAKLTASSSIADKPMDWLIMPKAFQDATKLPGIPIGYSTCVMGHSNTGKSTLINHAIVAAQHQGIIPVIIDTENSFSFEYAVAMGFKAEPVYGDVDVETVNPETGEITVETKNMIITGTATSCTTTTTFSLSSTETTTTVLEKPSTPTARQLSSRTFRPVSTKSSRPRPTVRLTRRSCSCGTQSAH